jgi:hypothetical protein
MVTNSKNNIDYYRACMGIQKKPEEKKESKYEMVNGRKKRRVINNQAKKLIEQDKKHMAKHVFSHQTFTKIKRDLANLFLIQKQTKARINGQCNSLHDIETLGVTRHSSPQGQQQFCNEHGSLNKFPPNIMEYEEAGMKHISICKPARDGDITEHPGFQRSLINNSPKNLLFPSVIRLGRERWRDTRDLIKATYLGIMTKEDPEKYSMNHHKPEDTRIDQRNRALKGHVLISVYNIKHLPKDVIDVLTNCTNIGHFLLVPLKVAKLYHFIKKDIKTMILGPLSNGLAKIKTLVLQGDRESYLVSSTT